MSNVNEQLLEQLPDQSVVNASVTFLAVRDLPLLDPVAMLVAFQTLHDATRFGLGTALTSVAVLSSPSGAIVIARLRSDLLPHRYISSITDVCRTSGLSIRIGVTAGEIESTQDVDGRTNFIGEVINIAARLANSPQNTGCIFHESYAEFAAALAVTRTTDPLNPRFASPLQVQGKPHDPPFKCKRLDAGTLPVLEHSDGDLLAAKEPSIREVVANVLSYDLPAFSQGDRATLSSRFRDIVAAFQQLTAQETMPKQPVFFSPGGDGGLLVFEGSKLLAWRLAERLIALLDVRTGLRTENANVRCRVALHHGAAQVYVNAQCIERPVGEPCFIAEKLIGDDVARRHTGVIFSREYRDTASDGSLDRFVQQYEQLSSLEYKGRHIERYVKRQSQPPARHELERLLESEGQPWVPLKDPQ